MINNYTLKERLDFLSLEDQAKFLLYDFPGAYTRPEFAAVIKVARDFTRHYARLIPQQPQECEGSLEGIRKILDFLESELTSFGYQHQFYDGAFKDLATYMYDYEKKLRSRFNDLMEHTSQMYRCIELPWAFLISESLAFKTHGGASNLPPNTIMPNVVQNHFEKIAEERARWTRLCIQAPDDGMHAAKIHSLIRQLGLSESLDSALVERLDDATHAHLEFYKKPYKLPSFRALFNSLYAEIDALE